VQLGVTIMRSQSSSAMLTSPGDHWIAGRSLLRRGAIDKSLGDLIDDNIIIIILILIIISFIINIITMIARIIIIIIIVGVCQDAAAGKPTQLQTRQARWAALREAWEARDHASCVLYNNNIR